MARRGNSEGSIYKRKDGRWAAAVSMPGAKRRTLYGKTRQEVAKKLNGALRDREAGLPTMPERQTLEQFLNQWLEAARPTVRHTTYVRYEEYVRLHINPVIGRVRLIGLTLQQVQNLYAQKLADGMSPTSVRHLHTVLHRALRQAVRWAMAVRNVTEAVDPPRRAHYDHQPLTPDQARLFLSAAQGDRLEALYVLALTTGMRQGELLGLSWHDVDLDIGSLQVRSTLQQGGVLGEPKTPKSRRRINLPVIAIEALRRHRILQLKERM
jgi:integrase